MRRTNTPDILVSDWSTQKDNDYWTAIIRGNWTGMFAKTTTFREILRL